MNTNMHTHTHTHTQMRAHTHTHTRLAMSGRSALNKLDISSAGTLCEVDLHHQLLLPTSTSYQPSMRIVGQ